MEQYDLWKLDKKLQKEVDEDRYHHTLGVMFTAASMAMVWGEDLEKARVAGLLHDCAKCIPKAGKVRCLVSCRFDIICNIDDLLQQCHIFFSCRMPGDGT